MGHVKPQLSPSSGFRLVGRGERLLSDGPHALCWEGVAAWGPFIVCPPRRRSGRQRLAMDSICSLPGTCGKGRCRWEGRCSRQDLGVTEPGGSRGDGMGYNPGENPRASSHSP